MSKILLTGTTGLVGGAFLARMVVEGREIRAAVRNARATLHRDVCKVVVQDLDSATDWSEALEGCDVVVHAAARVHVMHDQLSDPLAEFRKVNVDGTLNLARRATAAGIKRFIFISSIKVNGEETASGRPYRVDSLPAPEDAYGVSKLEAEQGLMRLANETGMEVVIIRPPLVYGPGVKGNFASMIKLVEMGVPLPLGAVRNKRSLVGIRNLVDLMTRCLDHPAAANQVFLASDGEDLSTTELLRGVGKALGKPARLIPVPNDILQIGATVLGKKGMARRLLGSLQVDISSTCELLDWRPPYTVEQGLKQCFDRSS